MLIFFFLFFQAEDGIRDPLVTGVQTCALPISRRRSAPWSTRGNFSPESARASCSRSGTGPSRSSAARAARRPAQRRGATEAVLAWVSFLLVAAAVFLLALLAFAVLRRAFEQYRARYVARSLRD